MPYMDSIPPEPPEQPAAEPVPQSPPQPAKRRIRSDLALFVGFAGGALVGLTLLELGFFRTLVIGGCGVLGVMFVRRQEELIAKIKELL